MCDIVGFSILGIWMMSSRTRYYYDTTAFTWAVWALLLCLYVFFKVCYTALQVHNGSGTQH